MAAVIMTADNPRDQKAHGRKVSNFDEKKWKANCRDIIKQGNLAKILFITLYLEFSVGGNPHYCNPNM